MTVAAAIVAIVIIGVALLAPFIALHDPYDLASVSLLDASDPPAWLNEGDWTYPLGTDNLGRDVLSTILYGTRLSLLTYPAPVSNAAVTPGFEQAIGANEPLRTGTYSKTLTFTLSTTSP